MQQYNVKRGIFGPGGHGGGIFQTTVSGLGSLGETPVVPWNCWDSPGFKDCHTQAISGASRSCELLGHSPSSSSWKGCYQPYFDERLQKCLTANCGVSAGGGSALPPALAAAIKTLPYGTYNENTKQVQIAVNNVLKTLGLPPITADGKLGAKSCSAISAVISSGAGGPGWALPAACAGGATVAPSLPSAPMPGLEPDAYAAPMNPFGLDEQTSMMVLGAAAVAGAYYLWKKNRQ